MSKKINILILMCLGFFGCKTNKSIRFSYLDSHEISPRMSFDSTLVGGISGIDFDSRTSTYYLISDDRSEHNSSRFYKADINLKNNKIDTIVFLKQVAILNEAKTKYKREESDFESIRYNRLKNNLVIGNEGGKKGKAGIKIIDTLGSQINDFQMDSSYVNQTRSNKSFESLCFYNDFKTLLYATEAPLVNDGEEASATQKGLIRIRESDFNTGKVKKEMMYWLDKVPQKAEVQPPWKGPGSDNGLAEILCLKNGGILTLERSGAYQKDGSFNYICKVFLVGENQKKELFDFSTLPYGKHNIEGMTLGPVINGKQSILFVSDNNFKDNIPTMVYLFTINH